VVAQDRFSLRINRQNALAAGAGDFKRIPHALQFIRKENAPGAGLRPSRYSL
jgi:hypothetical protein